MDDLRTAARSIYDAAIAAAEPGRLTRRVLEGISPQGRVILLAAGKAALSMARAAVEHLGNAIVDGLVVTHRADSTAVGPLPVIEAGHPLPNQESLEAGRRCLDHAGAAGVDHTLLCLVSGGASSLLAVPASPLSLSDMAGTTGQLIGSGAGIREINTVRKHLSAIKGGQLARAAHPARVITLLLSDVVGDHPEVIASGPTVPDPTRFGDALQVLTRHGLRSSVPEAALRHLVDGAAGVHDETPEPDDSCFRHVVTRIIGSNADARRGAARRAEQLGYRVVQRQQPVTGEAARVAGLFGDLARSADRRAQDDPLCHISGGETTVSLHGRHGRGGRNLELALAVAPLLSGCPRSLLLSAGTDGRDGSSDAAGAMALGDTMSRASDQGLDHAAALLGHDAHPFFEALGDLLVTGDTGTNVMDLQILLSGHHLKSTIT